METTTLSKYEGLGAAMAAELMIGFWFGIGGISAAKMVHSLEYCIEELISRKCQLNGRRKSSNDKRPKKVEAGKRLAEYNRRKREKLKVQKSESKQVLTSSQCYGIGAVLAVGVIGGIGYYLYQAKVNAVVPIQQPSHPRPQTNKFEME